MDMQGSRQLAITQQQSWDALNDPEVLKSCIPGCEKIEVTGENQFSMGVALKIGPLAAKFSGKIVLSDMVPPSSYTLSFEGQGGPAGFGKGSAKVELTPLAQGHMLNYTVHATVGGKIAQVGQRLIDGVAKSMAEDFFKRFDAAMQLRHPEAYAAQAENASATPAAQAPQAARAAAVPRWAWVAGGVFLLVLWLALR